MNVLLKRVVQRVILLVSSFILQIGVISFFLLKYSESFFDFYLASLTLSIIIVFIIINNKSNPSYKIAWIVPVMIFPIFGGLFYLLYGGNKLSTREKLKMVIQNIEMTNSLKQDDEIIKKIGDKSIYAKNQSEYILNYAKCPVYNNTETTYFKIGEEKFEALLKELKKAKKFIFLEYFKAGFSYIFLLLFHRGCCHLCLSQLLPGSLLLPACGWLPLPNLHNRQFLIW